MSDLLDKINATTTRMQELQKLCAEDEALANDHEKEARDARTRREANKKELQQLDTVLRHANAAQMVDNEHQAAQKARVAQESLTAEAAKTLESLNAKQAELEALIAKAKEPVEPPKVG